MIMGMGLGNNDEMENVCKMMSGMEWNYNDIQIKIPILVKTARFSLP